MIIAATYTSPDNALRIHVEGEAADDVRKQFAAMGVPLPAPVAVPAKTKQKSE